LVAIFLIFILEAAMRDIFIYTTSVIQTVILVAAIIICCNIAADIKEIKNTVNQQTHERNYGWYSPRYQGGKNDTAFLGR
jgi:hypothetical protein